ncbi:MAG TPA: GNAT family N-acetyltransferase [Casimicrobiaceae bacterium]|nr:GNAT family N-acetyltransferase [Casimicrobiaceae bacterium]
MEHYLRPLIEPTSIALVGASEREGSLGRVVYEKLLASGYAGALHAVNPRHASVLGKPASPSLAAIGAPIDLAIIATPKHAIMDAIANASGAKFAIVMTSPGAIDSEASAASSRDIASAATRAGVRVLGPGTLGVIRPSTQLEATWSTPSALQGRLALITQSGAVATAMLDFATPLRIGFSLVASVGGAIDIGFGDLLDFLALDDETDAIVMQVEDILDARPFLSALRAAARTKPVVVLRSGRSIDAASEIAHDEAFSAALMRCGAVRAQSYMQLFAAASVLAKGRIPQGERVAVVSNGRGPAVLAADSAFDRRLSLASFAQVTRERLEALLQEGVRCGNPVDIHGDAPPARLAEAVGFALDDPTVDAVVALHVPRPIATALEAARALASVAASHRKPVVAAWLGAIDRPRIHDALEAGGVVNLYTPEAAIEALSFLAEYRKNQAWLLEVPAQSPEPQPPDLAPLEALRTRLADESRTGLESAEAAQVLAAFGLTVKRSLEGPAAGAEMGIASDRRFGPVVFVRPSRSHSLVQRCASMLAPLNAPLAADLLARASSSSATARSPYAQTLADALTRLSALACALPWVRTLVLDVGIAAGGRLSVNAARFDVDPNRKLLRGYPHMAIHPYPIELVGDVALRDGTLIHVRPIRPEDAALERAFVDGLSQRARYFRFFYPLATLTPTMLARFTQVDYDRELALVALVDIDGVPTFVGVARYVANPDGASAEFAVVVADAWQRRGVARVLVHGLIVCAKRRGFERLRGAILRENDAMLAFVRAAGFTLADDPQDPTQVYATLALA